jgi:ribosome-associated heat shock protein Hsp15
MDQRVRLDKWLWAARFFKTRAIAARVCDLGRIQVNQIQAKPSREVRVGDMVHIKTDAAQFDVEVLQTSTIRGPAAVAQTLYRETDQSREARVKAAEERKTLAQMEGFYPDGRPSKRDRREIDRFRGRV